MPGSLADGEQERPGSVAGHPLDQAGQGSLGTFSSDPGGEPQENQFIWKGFDGDGMLLESKMTEDIDELLDPEGHLIFEIMGAPFVSGRCPHFCTNMVYGLQGIYGLTDAPLRILEPHSYYYWDMCSHLFFS